MFNWKDEYSCNISEIDLQHKNLFELGNKLYTIVSLSQKYDRFDEIVKTLEELRNYTIYHFEFEENLLKLHGYENIEEHKKQHEAFIKKVTSIDEEYMDLNQKKVSMDLLTFILDWIGNHILKTDMGYKEFLNNKGIY